MRTHVLISRILRRTAGISDACRRDTFHCCKRGLHAPEATRAKDHLFTRSLHVFLTEEKCGGVDAVAQLRRRWAVLEDVAEVRIAAHAVDFRSHHAVRVVSRAADGFLRDRLEKTRPARARFKLRIRAEQRQAARDAGVEPELVIVVEDSAERALGACSAGDTELFVRELQLPSIVGLRDLRHGDWVGKSACSIEEADCAGIDRCLHGFYVVLAEGLETRKCRRRYFRNSI